MPPANSPARINLSPDWLLPISPPSPPEVSAIRRLQQHEPDAGLAHLRRSGDLEDADADNVSFLRMEHEASEGISRHSSTDDTRRGQSETGDRRNEDFQSVSTNVAFPRGTRRRLDGNVMTSRRTTGAHVEPTSESLTREQTAQRYHAGTSRQPAEGSERSTLPHERVQRAYGEQLPREQSLGNWAPAGEEGDEEELEDILSELREYQPGITPEQLESAGRARLRALQASRYMTTASRTGPPRTWFQESTLRSSTILQNLQRSRRISTRPASRSPIDAEREQTDQPTHTSATREGNRSAASTQDLWSDGRSFDSEFAEPVLRHETTGSRTNHGRRENRSTNVYRSLVNGTGTERNLAERSESSRAMPRQMLEKATTRFEEVIKQFHNARDPRWDQSQSDSIRAPQHSLRMAKSSWEDGIRDHVKFLRNDIPRLQPTSWLAPGVMFSGFQQAPWVQSSSTTFRRLANNQNTNVGGHTSSRARLHISDSSQPQVYGGSHEEALIAAHPLDHQDRWTVKVAIHNVDYERMTMQGTMEAFNVPAIPPQPAHARTGVEESQNSLVHKTTFSTYLEGELVDLTTHTLLTEPSFPAPKTDPATDATYWKRLEPFKSMSDEQVAYALLDRRWLEEELLGKYVLMRWKERCFVRPIFQPSSGPLPPGSRISAGMSGVRVEPSATITSATSTFQPDAMGNGYGLSISGFYYASLRRSDGRIEGLYCDPQSSPHQQLELTVDRSTWSRGAWSLR